MRQVKRKTATFVVFGLGVVHAFIMVEFGWWGLIAAIPLGLVWGRMDYEEETDE